MHATALPDARIFYDICETQFHTLFVQQLINITTSVQQNTQSCVQVLGQGFSLRVLLENVKDHRPSSMVVGSHHYVQLSEFELSTTKITCADLRSVKSITPSGAAVPSICRQDSLDKMNCFRNCFTDYLSSLTNTYPVICLYSTL